MIYAKKIKLTREEKKEIRALFLSGLTVTEVSEKMNRSYNTILPYTKSEEEQEKHFKAREEKRKKGFNSERREKKKQAQIKYLNTEAGFIVMKYSDLAKSSRKRKESGKTGIEIFSREDFFEAWDEHKTKYGKRCAYTGEPVLLKRRLAKKNGKLNKVPPNLLSVDRLDPEKGYTKDNIVFCSWAVNDRKNAVTIKDCYRIIEIYEERNKNQ